MLGQMQTMPLNLVNILEHAATFHRQQKIISYTSGGEHHSYTYADALARVKQLANALKGAGINEGDRVATLGWNDHRHFETWYGTAGIGAVCHTVNPRLHPHQVTFIVNHGGAKLVMVDVTFLPLLEAIHDTFEHVQGYVVYCNKDNMPETSLPNAVDYESFIEGQADSYAWPTLNENAAAAMCYTSGTTGDPKGVVYSHRSNILQSLVCGGADLMNISSLSTVLMVVPMFHANSWGLVYTVPMFGGRLVLPGSNLGGESIQGMIEREQVDFSAAVPTVWNMLLDYLESSGKNLDTLKEVAIGGSAVPKSMLVTLKEKYQVDVLHAWGMTEMSPLGSLNRPTHETLKLPAEKQLELALKQGRPVYGVETCIMDYDGNVLANDGQTQGRLMVRGPWIIDSYYGKEESALDDNGWFDTGDIATIDEYGFMQLTDRAKDIIKSGGEWISSVDLENAAVGHPDVELAAVVGVPDDKWGERPLLVLKEKEGATVTDAAMAEYLDGKVAKWWIPERMVRTDDMPLTATGKLDKKVLRQRYSSGDKAVFEVDK